MEKYSSKAMRLRNPIKTVIQLRYPVAEFLAEKAAEVHCAMPVFIRGILEDFYDQYHAAPSEEVSNDA